MLEQVSGLSKQSVGEIAREKKILEKMATISIEVEKFGRKMDFELNMNFHFILVQYRQHKTCLERKTGSTKY